MPMAKTMFCLTMLMHFFDILIALETFLGSSSISTTSAASTAASDPMAPIAIPISARDSTGASFIPSPTKATASLLDDLEAISSSILSTLSPGRSSLYTSSIPMLFATSFAVVLLSPVSITVFLMPSAFSFDIASIVSSFTRSETTIYPAYLPSIAT